MTMMEMSVKPGKTVRKIRVNSQKRVNFLVSIFKYDF